jgi:hypothetical protein
VGFCGCGGGCGGGGCGGYVGLWCCGEGVR